MCRRRACAGAQTATYHHCCSRYSRWRMAVCVRGARPNAVCCGRFQWCGSGSSWTMNNNFVLAVRVRCFGGRVSEGGRQLEFRRRNDRVSMKCKGTIFRGVPSCGPPFRENRVRHAERRLREKGVRTQRGEILTNSIEATHVSLAVEVRNSPPPRRVTCEKINSGRENEGC